MKFVNLEEIKKIIKSGSTIAIGGFTINRKPVALVEEILKNDVKDLKLFVLGGSIDVDLLLKNKKVKKIFAAYVGYEGLGGSSLMRKAVESGEVEFEDLTELIYYLGLKAGAEKKEFFETTSLVNSDISKTSSICEKSGNICKIKPVNPDVCLIHAHRADKKGNILIDAPDFCEREMAMASKIVIVSVEEIGEIDSEKISIQNKIVDYIVVAPQGSLPTGCNNFYAPNLNKIWNFLNEKK